MKNTTLIFAALFSVLALSLFGCSRTKDAYLTEYRSFTDKVDENHKKYDEADWEKQNERMKVFLEKDFRDFEGEMKSSEKTEVMVKAYKYYFHQHKDETLDRIHDLNDEQFELMMGHLENVIDEGADFLDEIEPDLVEIGEEFIELGDKFLREMEDRGLVEKLEKMGKKLEEAGRKIEKKAEEMERRSEEL